MNVRNLSIALLAAGLFVSGCSKKTDDAQQAAQDAAKAAQQMAQNATNGMAPGAANKTPGVAIPAKTLVTFLPSPSGYTVQGEPEYMEMELQGTKYSHANAKYANGDKNISVGIFDYNFLSGLTAAYGMFLGMDLETNDESLHHDKINGFPAWMDWKKKSNDGTIGVVVNDRVFVVVEGHNGVSMDDLKAVASGVNLAGIAAAAK